MAQGTSRQANPEMVRCIQNCQDCHTSCVETASYCLQQGGRHTDADHLGVLLDCAEICQTSADFMLRRLPFHGRTCAVCAEVCERCAQDCECFGDDPTMKACAGVCRRCAESCRRMGGMRSAA